MSPSTEKMDNIKEYYGKILKDKNDLQTSACCTTETIPNYLKSIFAQIDDEVLSKFYGCGSPIPPALEGATVLDLGCGTGRDVYTCSPLVGEKGRVIGIDMTEEQLEVAKRHLDSQTKKFGLATPNVEFKKGYIEDLKALGIESNSIDVVISNCVINLSPDKEAVFSEIFRVLKPGGELLFSDVFTGRRIPEHLKSDKILQGECLAGAIYTHDFRRCLRHLGCLDYRVLNKRKLALENPEISRKAGMIDFYSMTIRAFKIESLEDVCEDYGQVATYLGTITERPHDFLLDDHHLFQTGKPTLVCGNTASMLSETRFRKHFEVTGNRLTHYGLFDCGPTVNVVDSSGAGSACC